MNLSRRIRCRGLCPIQIERLVQIKAGLCNLA